MKRLFVIAICFMMIGCISVQKRAEIIPKETAIEIIQENSKRYTYDGDIDPGTFKTWNIEGYKIDSDGYYHFIIINPDIKSDVKRVEIMVHQNVILIYQFLRDDILYLYSLDYDNNHYGQTYPKGLLW